MSNLLFKIPFGRRQVFNLIRNWAILNVLEKQASVHLRQKKPQLAVFTFDHGANIINLDGHYEAAELECIAAWLKKFNLNRGVAIDVGANIGNHTLYFRNLFSKVFAFEPDPLHFQLLRFNTRGSDGIICYNFGLSYKTACVPFTHENTRIVSGVNAIGADITIDVKALDDLPEISESHINLIKIDVEGHELQVLNGARKTIERNSPIILFEQHADEFKDDTSSVIECLRSMGYERFASVERAGRISSDIHSVFRIPATLIRLVATGYNYEVREFDFFDARFYQMLVAIPSGKGI